MTPVETKAFVQRLLDGYYDPLVRHAPHLLPNIKNALTDTLTRAEKAEAKATNLARWCQDYSVTLLREQEEVYHLQLTIDAAEAREAKLREALVDDLRQQGWSVAVHNDYRQDGRYVTFWLLTRRNGHWIKGEGETDAQALNQCRAALADGGPGNSASSPSSTKEPKP